MQLGNYSSRLASLPCMKTVVCLTFLSQPPWPQYHPQTTELKDKTTVFYYFQRKSSACTAACTFVTKIIFDTQYTNFLQDFRINYMGYNFNTYVRASINIQ